ncbi:phosphotransferase family protein [Halobaculum sp. MBLA0147]|uniref:phosphotransferase family protein n=1 Tax=Halobaculum sp. MBLA0147 TaxID=3079934 RepID=UPI00352352E2
MTVDDEEVTLDAEQRGSLGTDERTALRRWLAATLRAPVDSLSVLADGLNLVVAVSTTSEADAYVVRRPNELRETALFVDTATEYAVLERLVETPVPVPEPVAHCTDPSVLGAPFVVTEYRDGAVVPLGSRLPERYRTPAAREQLTWETVDTLARLHDVPVAQFRDVCEHHTPREQVAADVRRVERVADAVAADFADLLAVGDWLREHAPTDGPTRLVHGDFRPGNLLYADDPDHAAANAPNGETADVPTRAATGTRGDEVATATTATDGPLPRVAAVLDWETPMLGDPRVEIGYLLLRWRDAGDVTPSLDGFAERYGEATVADLREDNAVGMAPFTSEPGTPSRRAVLDRYERATGIVVDDPEYFLAHAAFTLAAVCADLHRRSVAAGADSDHHAHADYLRAVAETVIDGRFEI